MHRRGVLKDENNDDQQDRDTMNGRDNLDRKAGESAPNIAAEDELRGRSYE